MTLEHHKHRDLTIESYQDPSVMIVPINMVREYNDSYELAVVSNP